MRRRTRPARSRRRMCFETELSEMPNGAATSVTRASPEASRLRMLRRVSSASAISVSSRSIAIIFTQKDEYVKPDDSRIHCQATLAADGGSEVLEHGVDPLDEWGRGRSSGFVCEINGVCWK